MATITRRMERVLDELEQEFQSLYTKDDFLRQTALLREEELTSARHSILARLYQMLDQTGIAYEKGREAEYYETVIESAGLPDLEKQRTKILNAIYCRFREYPKPDEYLKRIVDRLENPEDQWSEDPLRLRILKQFIKYGDYLYAAEKGGKRAIQKYVKEKTGSKKLPGTEEVLAYLDDGVFDVLETATKAQKKPDGTYGLLKAVDDLAKGKFRVGGTTKKDLYLFALAYNMSYYTGRPDETIDYERDIEKNLFCDYYTNNLMRFLTDVYRGKHSEYDLDPSGRGINYENYAEIVYLYYIRKPLPPVEKIRRASGMIVEIRQREFHKGPKELLLKKETVEEILEKDEAEFEEYLQQHYHCDTYTRTDETKNGPVDNAMSEMQLEEEQKTAFQQYKLILKKLKERNVSRGDCYYGLWFTDIAKLRKEDVQDPENFQEFMELLAALSSFLGKNSEHKTRALYITSPKKVTRTSLLVAYYYYFNDLYVEDTAMRNKSFKEVFDLFKNGLDQYLKPSGYQPVSGRNIIDVLVIFSSYTYFNG